MGSGSSKTNPKKQRSSQNMQNRQREPEKPQYLQAGDQYLVEYMKNYQHSPAQVLTFQNNLDLEHTLITKVTFMKRPLDFPELIFADHWGALFILEKENKSFYMTVHLQQHGLIFFIRNEESEDLKFFAGDNHQVQDVERIETIVIRQNKRISGIELVQKLFKCPKLDRGYQAALWNSNNCIDFAVWLAEEICGLTKQTSKALEKMKQQPRGLP